MRTRWWEPIPYPRFVPKGCDEGAHVMRRDPDGLKAWICTLCGQRKPFYGEADQ